MSKLAVIATGGKQYLVREGDQLDIEKLAASPDTEIAFDQVLLLQNGSLYLGHPYVAGAVVRAKVLLQDKAQKIRVFKYRAKSRYRRTLGHRQAFTRVQVTKIEAASRP